MQIESLRRPPLHDELAEQLRDLIIRGVLAPGSKVQEQVLCDQFGVSRTPLREALRSLGSEGLILHTPRRGTTISPVTLADLEEAFPILGALEGLAGELACQNISDAAIAEARDLQARMEREHAAGDREAYFRTNEDIHRLILAAADNPTLARMIHSLDGRVRRARYFANVSTDRWSQAVSEHAEMLVALEVRDATALRRLLTRHLANKFEAIARRLAEEGVG